MTDRNSIRLELDIDQLKKLHKDLKVQASHMESKLSRLERDLMIGAMTVHSGIETEEGKDALEAAAKVTNKMLNTQQSLQPIRRKLAALEALLDNDTVFWLTVSAGSCEDIIDGFLEDTLGEGAKKVSEVEEPNVVPKEEKAKSDIKELRKMQGNTTSDKKPKKKQPDKFKDLLEDI